MTQQHHNDPQNTPGNEESGRGERESNPQTPTQGHQGRSTGGGGNAGNESSSQASGTGDQSAGSQGHTTGYGTGQSGGAAAASPQKDSPSNAGDAGPQGAEGGGVSPERVSQMSHADGESGDDDELTSTGF